MIPRWPQSYASGMAARTDLYWDDVAEAFEGWATPDRPSTFTLAWSLLENGDLEPAAAVLAAATTDTPGTRHLASLLDRDDRLHPSPRPTVETILPNPEASAHDGVRAEPRYHAVREALDALAIGAVVLVDGHDRALLETLAQDLPPRSVLPSRRGGRTFRRIGRRRLARAMPAALVDARRARSAAHTRCSGRAADLLGRTPHRGGHIALLGHRQMDAADHAG